MMPQQQQREEQQQQQQRSLAGKYKSSKAAEAEQHCSSDSSKLLGC
jgi:hypothetical protein